jgi:DNA-binding beta-propeller fold protein YncE
MSPLGVSLDALGNRLLVVDYDLDALLLVDIASGIRTTVSAPGIPDSNEPLDFPRRVAFDPALDRALIGDIGRNAVMAVDLATGIRSVLSSVTVPVDGGPIRAPMPLTVDAAGDRLIVADPGMGSGMRFIEVNLATGTAATIEPLSDSNVFNRISNVNGIAVDSVNQVVYATSPDVNGILTVDLVTGERVFVSR